MRVCVHIPFITWTFPALESSQIQGQTTTGTAVARTIVRYTPWLVMARWV